MFVNIKSSLWVTNRVVLSLLLARGSKVMVLKSLDIVVVITKALYIASLVVCYG